MKLPNSLLLFALTIGFTFFSSSEVPAFGGRPGGPFSNGSYFPNDGTFSAVVRGENLTGTLQFSTTSGAGPAAVGGTGGLGSTGVATIYYDGDTYQGNSQGALNAEASTMTVNFQADSEQQGQREVTLQERILMDSFVDPDTGLTIDEYEMVDTAIISYFDSLVLSGFADCKTSNAFPNQKFEGSGEAELQILVANLGNTPFLDAISFPISVTGVRVSNMASAFNVSNVRPPSVNEITIFTP
jgi:hypothetical protein